MFSSLTGITQSKKDDLLTYLKEDNIDNLESYNKVELVELARNKFLNNSVSLNVEAEIESDSIVLNVEHEDEETYEEDEEINDLPELVEDGMNPDDPGWTDYVLSLLRDNEKVDNKPKADGLRRVFPHLMGPILSTDVKVPGTATAENENRATVIYQMQFMHQGRLVTRTEAADSSYRNTQKPYSSHPTATATTMAEGRCLRKALNLQTLMLEETMAEDDGVENMTFISENHINIMNKVANKFNIDLEKFLRHMDFIKPEHSVDNIDKILTSANGQEILRTFNRFNKGPGDPHYLPIPADILKNVPVNS